MQILLQTFLYFRKISDSFPMFPCKVCVFFLPRARALYILITPLSPKHGCTAPGLPLPSIHLSRQVVWWHRGEVALYLVDTTWGWFWAGRMREQIVLF